MLICPPCNQDCNQGRFCPFKNLIKTEPKPDVIKYASFGFKDSRKLWIHKNKNSFSQIELTFDGTTGHLKSAKVIK